MQKKSLGAIENRGRHSDSNVVQGSKKKIKVFSYIISYQKHIKISPFLTYLSLNSTHKIDHGSEEFSLHTKPRLIPCCWSSVTQYNTINIFKDAIQRRIDGRRGSRKFFQGGGSNLDV